MPVNDYDWFVCSGAGKGTNWFCAACGKQYCHVGGAFVFGMQLNEESSSMHIWSIEPPTGKQQNFLNYFTMGTAIKNGSFNFTMDDQIRLAEVMKEIKKFIVEDNKQCGIALAEVKHVQRVVLPILMPDDDKGRLQALSVKEGEYVITLQASKVDQTETFFDFSKLHIFEAEHTLSGASWDQIINMIYTAFNLADAIALALIPEATTKSDTSKNLRWLAEARRIMHSGRWSDGRVASDKEKEDAMQACPFPSSPSSAKDAKQA